MKYWSTLAGALIFLATLARSQPVIQVESGYWHFPLIDDIVQTYQFSHPWNEETIVPLGISAGAAAGWNQQVYAPRGLHALGLVHYRYQTTAWESSSNALTAAFHTLSADIHLRTHPRCLFKQVQNTGPMGTRWYVQLGGGMEWNLPLAVKHGEKVTLAGNAPYTTISRNLKIAMSSGWHTLSIGPLILTLEAGASFYPQFRLEGFATAINGHNEMQLAEVAKNVWLMQGAIRLTYSKAKKNWWDAPRQGDKS